MPPTPTQLASLSCAWHWILLCRALFYLAQHHDKLGNTDEALRLVDRCIEVGPNDRRACESCI